MIRHPQIDLIGSSLVNRLFKKIRSDDRSSHIKDKFISYCFDKLCCYHLILFLFSNTPQN